MNRSLFFVALCAASLALDIAWHNPLWLIVSQAVILGAWLEIALHELGQRR